MQREAMHLRRIYDKKKERRKNIVYVDFDKFIQDEHIANIISSNRRLKLLSCVRLIDSFKLKMHLVDDAELLTNQIRKILIDDLDVRASDFDKVRIDDARTVIGFLAEVGEGIRLYDIAMKTRKDGVGIAAVWGLYKLSFIQSLVLLSENSELDVVKNYAGLAVHKLSIHSRAQNEYLMNQWLISQV